MKLFRSDSNLPLTVLTDISGREFPFPHLQYNQFRETVLYFDPNLVILLSKKFFRNDSY